MCIGHLLCTQYLNISKELKISSLEALIVLTFIEHLLSIPNTLWASI